MKKRISFLFFIMLLLCGNLVGMQDSCDPCATTCDLSDAEDMAAPFAPGELGVLPSELMIKILSLMPYSNRRLARAVNGELVQLPAAKDLLHRFLMGCYTTRSRTASLRLMLWKILKSKMVVKQTLLLFL